MKVRKLVASTALLTLGVGACGENPVSPTRPSPGVALQQQVPKGTGLAVDIVPNVTLPLGLGGTITIDQVVITNFALIENTVGQIVGLEVTGNLSGTAVDVLGNLIGVNVEPFTANVAVTSQGPGQCSVVTLDLTGLDLDVLGLVTGHLPVNVDVKGSGAVGSLLCALGNLLGGLGSGLSGTPGAQGVVDAINNQIS